MPMGKPLDGKEPEGVRMTWPLTVRWAECDAAGIIFHGRVFEWFSEARVAWLARNGVSYYRDVVPEGVELLVTEATAQFRRPLKAGDGVAVEVWVSRLSPARMHFAYRAWHGRETAVAGETHHAFVMDGRAGNLKKAHPRLYEVLRGGTGLPTEI
ncbi:MAG: thioesterase family protein [Thermaerobacter sp.]|nr:thioesterase family protein [Thermaerobacter sp.]